MSEGRDPNINLDDLLAHGEHSDGEHDVDVFELADVPAQEILERMVYPMINEGARILEEKIASRPSDIDVIWLYGYGWPIYRGGPMFYADLVGLKEIAERLSFYAKQTNDTSLEPAPLLKKLADEGKTFASLGK